MRHADRDAFIGHLRARFGDGRRATGRALKRILDIADQLPRRAVNEGSADPRDMMRLAGLPTPEGMFEALHTTPEQGAAYIPIADQDRMTCVLDTIRRCHPLDADDRVLDIGAGPGLLAAAATWDVPDVDLTLVDSIAATQAAAVLYDTAGIGGRPVTRIAGAAPDVLPDGPFDLVVAINTVEFAADPIGLLVDAANRLASGGSLVVQGNLYFDAVELAFLCGEGNVTAAAAWHGCSADDAIDARHSPATIHFTAA